jgi:uncharacterized protein YqfB (UPF0267 family)
LIRQIVPVLYFTIQRDRDTTDPEALMMEIQLPEVQSCLDNIKDGSITTIRLPGMELKAGDILSVRSSSGNDNVIHLKVLTSETVPLETITATEAEREGFTAPDFCSSQFICGNIETRLGFEDYAFAYENGVPVARSQEDRELYLREKVRRLCPSCLTRKNAKDLFLQYWKSKAVDGEMTKISFEVTS